MKDPSLGRKPTDQHILWESGKGKASKRFHEDYLRKWCQHMNIDFDTYSRVDHERSEESRQQYQCVFSYRDGGGESFRMGDEEWDIQTKESPASFMEIDEAGMMRLHVDSRKAVLDVEELWHDGPELIVRPADREEPLRLDVSELGE